MIIGNIGQDTVFFSGKYYWHFFYFYNTFFGDGNFDFYSGNK